MRAIRTFTIRASLPGPLAPLHELMLNLRWSWHAGTRELFTALDPAGREQAGRDPVALLGEVPPEHLAALAADEEYLARLHRAVADLRDYLSADRWYQQSGGGREARGRDEQSGGGREARGRDEQSGGGREARGRDQQSGGGPPAAIAYFSPEYGIAAALPQYSGGLGILAGDHLKAASDLGVPLIGVGLLYRHGYFSQSLSPEGWQLERYPAGDPNGLPLTLLRGADGAPVTVVLTLGEGGPLAAQVWLAQVGRVPLLLLDSYVEQNDPGLREVTDRLYGGGSEHRLRQELLLGMGGVRAVRAYCALTGHPQPEVFHTNEGHAGFLGLERIREYAAAGLSFDEAIEMCRASTVFTTHTPVAAGIDRFARDLVEREFSGAAADPALPAGRVLALGAETYPGGDPAVFNMAVMGMRLAQRVNGVSLLHGQVSREMFAGLWPGFDASEVPIGSITNGVHVATWVAPEILGRGAVDAAAPGPGHGDGPAWDRIGETGPAALWEIRTVLRRRLIAEARRWLRASWRQRGVSEAELGWTGHALDENVLTIGFARRVPSYKRLTLMLHDPERLTALLLDPRRPVQLVIAGKAHPADDGGKQLIQQMIRFAEDPRVRHRIVFLPDYDMELGAAMVQGCDVWLNNPLRPLEACGTSGMKAALNGALNLSVLDGWWDEWFDGENGWAIPSADDVADPARRDELESAALYDLLEQVVAPLFYDTGDGGLPQRWLEMVAHTLAGLGPRAEAARMVREYVQALYVPAARASRALAGGPGPGGYAAARDLAAWKRRVTAAWPGVRIEHIEAGDGDRGPGEWLPVRASVALGGLSPQDVTVEVICGRVNDGEDIVEPAASPLAPGEGAPAEGTADGIAAQERGVAAGGASGGPAPWAGTVRYAGEARLGRPGPFGYTVRVVPCHPLLASTAELGLVTYPDAPEGMTNGDLR